MIVVRRGWARIIAVVAEIPAIDVVDVTVAVIIHAVAGHLPGIREDVGLQIGMVDLDGVIDDGDDDT